MDSCFWTGFEKQAGKGGKVGRYIAMKAGKIRSSFAGSKNPLKHHKDMKKSYADSQEAVRGDNLARAKHHLGTGDYQKGQRNTAAKKLALTGGTLLTAGGTAKGIHSMTKKKKESA